MELKEIISYLEFYVEGLPHHNQNNDTITLSYEIIKTLLDYFIRANQCLSFLDSIIITPDNPTDIMTKHSLHNYSKQELYKSLYSFRKYIIDNDLLFKRR